MGELLPAQTQVPRCFGCGLDNPSGLRLRFTREGAKVSTRFTPPADWTGWGELMHGGFHGVLLDEAMGWAAWVLAGATAFVTKQLTIQYRRPIRVGTPLVITASVHDDGPEVIITRGEIADESGQVLTQGEGRMVRVGVGKVAAP